MKLFLSKKMMPFQIHKEWTASKYQTGILKNPEFQ